MRLSNRGTPLVLSLLLSGVGCSSSMRPAGAEPQPSPQTVLTRSELDELAPGRTALDAIQLLRTRWLARTRSPHEPSVYVDNVRQGGVEFLRLIRVSQIQELRFLSARDATTRWGTNHSGGAIEVVLGAWGRFLFPL